MDKQRVLTALDIIKEEVEKQEYDESTDGAIYQIYCVANCFIANEIKRIIKEEGSVTSEHPEIAPLYKLFHAIIEPMKKYSKIVRERESN